MNSGLLYIHETITARVFLLNKVRRVTNSSHYMRTWPINKWQTCGYIFRSLSLPINRNTFNSFTLFFAIKPVSLCNHLLFAFILLFNNFSFNQRIFFSHFLIYLIFLQLKKMLEDFLHLQFIFV